MNTSPSPTATIYVRLLDEGTDVWRPTLGRKLGPMKYEVLPTPNYDSDDEKWEFLPGSIVLCGWSREGEELLWRANARADAPPELKFRPRSIVEFIGRNEPGGAPWIDTLVDGKPLEQIVAAAADSEKREAAGPWQGSEPYELLPPKGSLLGGHGGVQLLVCAGCREPGCDPVTCAIEVFDGEIVWSEFHQGNMTTQLRSVGPFVFDRKQYEAAVARAAGWDSRKHTAS